MGFTDYLKELTSEQTFKDIAYLVGGGMASAFVGGLFGRLSNDNKYMKYIGYALGSIGASYVVNNFVKDMSGARYALVGGLFPPIWKFIEEKVNPEEYGQKLALSLGMQWKQGATHALAVYEIPSTTRLSQISNPQPASPTAVSNISY